MPPISHYLSKASDTNTLTTDLFYGSSKTIPKPTILYRDSSLDDKKTLLLMTSTASPACVEIEDFKGTYHGNALIVEVPLLDVRHCFLAQLPNANMAEMKRKSKKRAIGFVYNSDLFGFKD